MGWWKKVKEGVKKFIKKVVEEPVRAIITVAGGIAGGAVGLAIGGPAGAVAGALIGIGICRVRFGIRRLPAPGSEVKVPKKVPPVEKAPAEKVPPVEKAPAEKVPPVEEAPKYMGNSNTKEIHDLSKTTKACQIDKMEDRNKVFFDTLEDVERARDEGYNGCKWCLPEYDTG